MRIKKVSGLSLLMAVFIAFGCSAQEKAVSVKDAIETAKTIAAVGEKSSYLIDQAKVFYSSEDFQSAVELAQYVLQNVDKDSKDAKALLEKAKQALSAKAKEAVDATADSMKNKIGSLGQ